MSNFIPVKSKSDYSGLAEIRPEMVPPFYFPSITHSLSLFSCLTFGAEYVADIIAPAWIRRRTRWRPNRRWISGRDRRFDCRRTKFLVDCSPQHAPFQIRRGRAFHVVWILKLEQGELFLILIGCIVFVLKRRRPSIHTSFFESAKIQCSIR